MKRDAQAGKRKMWGQKERGKGRKETKKEKGRQVSMRCKGR